MNWFLDTTEETILAALPEEVGDEERRRLVASFRAFREGVADGSLDTRGLTQLQVELTNAYSRAQRGLLEKVDVERLLSAFEDVVGRPGELPIEDPKPGSPAEIPIAWLESLRQWSAPEELWPT